MLLFVTGHTYLVDIICVVIMYGRGKSVTMVLQRGSLVHRGLPLVFGVQIGVFVCTTRPFTIVVMVVSYGFGIQLVTFKVLGPIRQDKGNVTPYAMKGGVTLFTKGVWVLPLPFMVTFGQTYRLTTFYGTIRPHPNCKTYTTTRVFPDHRTIIGQKVFGGVGNTYIVTFFGLRVIGPRNTMDIEPGTRVRFGHYTHKRVGNCTSTLPTIYNVYFFGRLTMGVFTI